MSKHNHIVRWFFIFFTAAAISLFSAGNNAVFFVSNAYSQGKEEYRDYLLKKVGNLYILNIGAQDGVKEYAVYNLYFEEARRIPLIRLKIKTKRVLFGVVEVTQIFPEYCVVRIISRVMEGEPQGSRIILEHKGLPEKLLTQYTSPFAIPVQPEQKVVPKPIVKTIKSDVRSPLYKPFSLGFSYVSGYNEIPEPLSKTITDRLNRDVYAESGVFSNKLVSSGGASLSLSKGITHVLALQGNISYLKHKSELQSYRNPASPPPVGIVAVSLWDFNIETNVTAYSLSLQFSQFSNATAYLAKLPRKRSLVPRIGVGFDYFTADVTMKEQVEVAKFTSTESRSILEKQSIGGYRGMHISAGIDYYLNIYRFFGEVGYTYWFTDKFESSIPFRFGVSLFF